MNRNAEHQRGLNHRLAVTFMTVWLLSISACSRSDDAELAKAKADAEIARLELAKAKAEAEAASAKLDAVSAKAKADAAIQKAQSDAALRQASLSQTNTVAVAPSKTEAVPTPVAVPPSDKATAASPDSDAICGTWESRMPDGKPVTYVFDKSGSMNCLGSFSGTWKLVDGKLQIHVGGPFSMFESHTSVYAYSLPHPNLLTLHETHDISSAGKITAVQRPPSTWTRKSQPPPSVATQPPQTTMATSPSPQVQNIAPIPPSNVSPVPSPQDDKAARAAKRKVLEIELIDVESSLANDERTMRDGEADYRKLQAELEKARSEYAKISTPDLSAKYIFTNEEPYKQKIKQVEKAMDRSAYLNAKFRHEDLTIRVRQIKKELIELRD